VKALCKQQMPFTPSAPVD